MRPNTPDLDTTSGLTQMKNDVLGPSWPESNGQRNVLQTRCASSSSLKFESNYACGLCRSVSNYVMFAVVDELFIALMLGTAFSDQLINPIHLAQLELVKPIHPTEL